MGEEGTKARGHEGTKGAGATENRVDRALRGRLEEGQKGLMPFICGGHPTLETTRSVLPSLARAGADVVEVGIPFSDPIADGPAIAGAMHEALERNVTPAGVLGAIRAARDSGRIEELGVVVMVSVSIVWRRGVDQFMREAREATVDGLVFPDAPLEEAGPLLESARAAGLTASLLVAPSTPPMRAQEIARASSGFVYVLARMGITGDGGGNGGHPDLTGLRARISSLREASHVPIACGFGVAGPEDVARIIGEGGADGAIVGSALVKRMGRRWKLGDDPVVEAENFVRSLRAAADRT